MVAEHQRRRGRRARLRATVLRLGALLGWKPQEVIAFTEELTDCPWRRCDCEEFEAVLDEYLELGRLIQQKVTRQRTRDRNTTAIEPGGGSDASTR